LSSRVLHFERVTSTRQGFVCIAPRYICLYIISKLTNTLSLSLSRFHTHTHTHTHSHTLTHTHTHSLCTYTAAAPPESLSLYVYIYTAAAPPRCRWCANTILSLSLSLIVSLSLSPSLSLLLNIYTAAAPPRCRWCASDRFRGSCRPSSPSVPCTSRARCPAACHFLKSMLYSDFAKSIYLGTDLLRKVCMCVYVCVCVFVCVWMIPAACACGAARHPPQSIRPAHTSQGCRGKTGVQKFQKSFP